MDFQKPDSKNPTLIAPFVTTLLHLRVQGWLIIGKSDASVAISRSDVADI